MRANKSPMWREGRSSPSCRHQATGTAGSLQTTLAAVVLGASFIERHITLDRAMWGTDQAASLEPNGITRLVRDIRLVETALGDGRKAVRPSEIPVMKKLRRVG